MLNLRESARGGAERPPREEEGMGDAIHIDNRRYHKDGEVSLTTGTGDSASTFSFTALTSESGETLYLHNDNNVYRLYRPSGLPRPAHDVSESIQLSKTSDYGDFAGATGSFMSWATTMAPLDEAPEPFRGTRDIMLLDAQTFYNVTLVQERTDWFYSAFFPAADIQPAPVPTASVPRALEFVNMALVLGAVAWLVNGALTDNSAAVTALWWGGIVCWALSAMGRRFPLNAACHVISAGFLLHFVTHGLDIWAINAMGDAAGIAFESAKAAVILTVLTVMRLAFRRQYFVLADGARNGGGCAWALFLCGLIFWSMIDEYWWGQWFSWYSGSLPWAVLWPLIMAGFLHHKWDDYSRVPLSARGFRSCLFSLGEELGKELEAVRRFVPELKARADDLEDALQLALDPQVTAFYCLGPEFLKVRDALAKLEKEGELDPRDAQRVTHDLQVLSQDLLGLHAAFDAPSSLTTLRVSPFLRTRE